MRIHIVINKDYFKGKFCLLLDVTLTAILSFCILYKALSNRLIEKGKDYILSFCLLYS